jgi:hypothetical protein
VSSNVSEPAVLHRPPQTPARAASPSVINTTIRSIAITHPKKRAWTLSGSASLPFTTTRGWTIVAIQYLRRQARLFGVGTPQGLQFSIALCSVLVAATLAPNIRRVMPRWFEIGLWVALIFVCWLGIDSIKDPQARELTTSINWALGKMVNTMIGLAGLSVVDVLHANRFAIANAVVTLFAADLLALALLWSYREGRGWQPKVRLGDWMELPAAPVSVLVQAPQPYAVDELNERLAAATVTAGAAAATWSVQFLIWARDIGLPRAEKRLALAAAVGRVESNVLLEAVRETARDLENGARDLVAASSPEVNKLALRVAAILNGVTDAEQRVSPSAGNLAQVVDIQALRIAQSLGRSGRAQSTEKKDEIDNDPEHPDRLAS